MNQKNAIARQTRLRRSALFVPAINERALEKSASLAADCLIIDLEDSVAPAKKAQARENLRKHFDQLRSNGHEVVIRINPLATHEGVEDLMAALACAPHGDSFAKNIKLTRAI